MLNFFQDVEISIDYDFEHIEVPKNFEKMKLKNYIFISPYSFENKTYATNPYIKRCESPYEEDFLENDFLQKDSPVEYNIEIQLNNFEKELIKNSEQTETIFYSDGKFETNLPSGEVYENKFDDISIAPYYLEELNSGFEDVNGFGIEYFDKATNTIKKWLVMFNKNEEEYHLHGLESYSKQVDNVYKGSYNDFKMMISSIIHESCGYELRSAVFYQ